MTQTLLLRLAAAGEIAGEWLSVDETGAALGPTERGPLAHAAAAAAAAARVVVLVPATQVLLAEPELPPGSGARLARAVPFALEEQLTEDIDQLCFAIGRRNARGATPVAVVSRTTMQAWLAVLGGAGIAPAAIYADIALMADNPGQTVLWLERERLAVRRPGALPFAVEVAPVTDALMIAGVIADPDADPSAAGARLAESAILYATREDWTRIQAEFEDLMEQFATLRIQLLADGPLHWLARQLHAGDAVNLLQGEFAATSEYRNRWREWRVAAMLALGLLGAHVAAQAIQLHHANEQTAMLDGQITRLFAATLPNETLRDARRQMQARLASIRRGGGGAQVFLHLMQALGRALGQNPQTRIDALSFRERSLEMQASAASIDVFARLVQALGTQGVTAAIESSRPNAGGIQAHLRLTLGAAPAR
ncbi:MAG TPA: type II secretion system protein GspL [Steroidobacteraceae bacterium]|nr:type II secretion system protein GspL [Steroidobacteraceae bacterium]